MCITAKRVYYSDHLWVNKMALIGRWSLYGSQNQFTGTQPCGLNREVVSGHYVTTSYGTATNTIPNVVFAVVCRFSVGSAVVSKLSRLT